MSEAVRDPREVVLYNTRTRSKEALRPLEPGKVGIDHQTRAISGIIAR